MPSISQPAKPKYFVVTTFVIVLLFLFCLLLLFYFVYYPGVLVKSDVLDGLVVVVITQNNDFHVALANNNLRKIREDLQALHVVKGQHQHWLLSKEVVKISYAIGEFCGSGISPVASPWRCLDHRASVQAVCPTKRYLPLDCRKLIFHK